MLADVSLRFPLCELSTGTMFLEFTSYFFVFGQYLKDFVVFASLLQVCKGLLLYVFTCLQFNYYKSPEKIKKMKTQFGIFGCF